MRGRWRLTVYFALCAAVLLLAAVAAVAYVFVQTDRDSRHTAASDAHYAATTAAGQLGSGVATLKATVAQLAATPQIEAGAEQPTCALSFAIGDLSRGHLDVLRPNGTVACSSRPPTGGKPLAGYANATWRANIGKSPVLLAPIDDTATGDRSMVAAARTPKGWIIAAFAALSPIGPSLAKLYSGGKPVVFLVTSSDGRVLTRSIAPARWIGTSVEGTAFARGTGQVERKDLDGHARLYEESAVAGTGWRFFAGEDKSEVLAAGHRLRERQLAIIAAGLALAMLALWGVYRKVAVPMRRLGDHVRASAAQTPPELVPVSGPTEVAALGDDVNSLISSVGDELARRQDAELSALQSERQLRQAQKMEAVGQLAGGVAHDFNNLLTVIAGYSGIARNRIGAGPGAKEIAEIDHATERATQLTRQLLAFSRQQVLEPAVLDLNEVIEAVMPMLARLIGDEIEIGVLAGGELPYVFADRGQLEQVIVNLVVNARDAMPDGGTITIDTRRVRLDDRYAAEHAGVEAGVYACLAVTDTGSGMDSETQSRIFEPFFTTKGDVGGTGLGLATVHGIARQSGGYVELYSEPGLGTSFKVYIPATEGKPVTLERAPAVGPETLRGSETLLVCEDDEFVRILLETILTENGYRILVASRAEEALELATANEDEIDALVTDTVMPHMSGLDLIERLRESRPHVRVILLSGYSAEVLKERTLPADTVFLQKPFDDVTLLQRLRSLLDEQAGVRPGARRQGSDSVR